MDATGTPQALYARLLGPRWAELSPVLRALHAVSSRLDARGVFRIRHGEGRLARALARLLRAPHEGNAVATRLVVRATPSGEIWSRTFGRSRLVSSQRQGAGGELHERFGPMVLRFLLHVDGGALVVQHVGTLLGWPPLLVGLPARLAPRVSARESAGDDGGHVAASVEIAMPLLGPFLRYNGTLECRAATA